MKLYKSIVTIKKSLEITEGEIYRVYDCEGARIKVIMDDFWAKRDVDLDEFIADRECVITESELRLYFVEVE